MNSHVRSFLAMAKSEQMGRERPEVDQTELLGMATSKGPATGMVDSLETLLI